MPGKSREEWEAEFKRDGVGKVRAGLQTNVYLQGGAAGLAKAWLAEQEAAADDEILLLARRADHRSLVSNWIAIFAVVIALASMLVALFHK
jgi:hypothetical protein